MGDNLATQVLNAIDRVTTSAEKSESYGTDVKKAFNAKLSEFGIDDVKITSVKRDGAETIVEFEHEDGESGDTVVFGADEDGAIAALSSDQEELGEDEMILMDIDLLDPKISEEGAIDLTNLSFLNQKALTALFTDYEEEKSDNKDERFKVKIRGGKKVKVNVLTGAKLAKAKKAAKKGARKRKGKKQSAAMKRAIAKGKKMAKKFRK